MLRHKILCLLLLFFVTRQAVAQGDCTTIGQNPSTAFPVCGTEVFEQQSVPICGSRSVPGPSCSTPGDFNHQDKNPFWYKFTCYTTGTLGFVITPLDLEEDYDWQLWDITGRDPDEVYTNRSLYVAMNWSGEYGITGASDEGASTDVCGGRGQPLFSAMPVITKGHEYQLLISHFSNSQSGYKLKFGGGTADINDPVLPELKGIKYDCAGYSIGIKLSRKVLCKSLATNGSDFRLSTGASITKATGASCNNGFDLDSVILYLDKPLPSGTYTVTAQNGSDGHTVLNACGKQLLPGAAISFSVPVTPPPRLPALKALLCAPDRIMLEFPDPVRCSSIAADGSDFTITGPSAIQVIATEKICDAAGLTQMVTLKLDRRILRDGDYTLTLTGGTDGNTVTSACHVPLIPGNLPFSIPAQPAILLGHFAPPGCAPSSVKIGLNLPVRCSSIAPDGSDFMLSGPHNIRITGAAGICNTNGMADSIVLQLSGKIQTAGNYRVTTTTGSDGNSLQGECWQLITAGQTADFRTSDTVNASFTMSLQFNCKLTTASFFHDGRNHVNSWTWELDGETLHTQHPVKVFSDFGAKPLRLEVTNGVCSARLDTAIVITSELEAAFTVDPGPYCPMESITPVNISTGNIVAWEWDYGNGNSSFGAQPLSLRYFPQQKEQDYRIRLIVRNDMNCRDTTDRYIKAASSCYIDVPTAFTPNNDGQNDFFYPLNAYRAQDLRFRVYSRYGRLMFESQDWRKRWNGRVNNVPADAGAYTWMLEYTEKDSGKKVFRKGTVVLLR